ncbi:hydrolase [Pantoea sp. RIT-PI-b]|uniref:amidohydrolase n=1 Tax=Pantoea sp. RIT-PI-b TaxID=1681195 RepID=UPI000675F0A6|nr:amidohydrolase [Pantoea sp. RIT-PI-b]KNC05843.1 hydrolase [Pantoea sp. RIT-PI-b]
MSPLLDTLGEQLIAFRHELHRFPELSNEEFETTARIRQQLEQHHIRVLDLPLKTGLVAEIGPEQGPLIVLRSDIDALPIEEQSDVTFRSERPGVMHACGHDFHSSAALGAAILLKQQESTLPGRVRILFQAAEETGQGAPDVIATGALDDAVAIFGIHNDPSLPPGVIGSKAGPLTAAVDRFDISITGIGSHAAKPHQGNDPIVIAAQIVSAAQTLISRNAPSGDNAVVSITQIHSGSTWNVIPDSAWLEGTVRSFSQQTRERLEQRFREIVQGIGAAFAAEVKFNWHAGPPSVVNDAHWADFALQQASASGFEARVVEASPIGEDFAFYQQQLPGAFMMIGTGEPYALHHPAFRINDEVLLPTARYLSDLALAALRSLEHTR